MAELTKFNSKHKKYLVCDTTDFFCPVEVYAEDFHDAAVKVAKVWEKEYGWQPDDWEAIVHIEMVGWSSYEKGHLRIWMAEVEDGRRQTPYPVYDYKTVERMSYQ